MTYLNDGCHYEVSPDGSWDLVLPSGMHRRGKAADAASAEIAARAAHAAFVLAQWAKGSPIAGGVMHVPLR